MRETVSFIVPTTGRPSLKKTIASIDLWPGDELLVVSHLEPQGFYGFAERNEAMTKATRDYLAFIDDDDCYVDGHRQMMHEAAEANPNGWPVLFRMQYPSGKVLWKEPELRCGNVGTPMIFVPNVPESFPNLWEPRRTTDFQFINCWGWKHRHMVWNPNVIAMLGFNDRRPGGNRGPV